MAAHRHGEIRLDTTLLERVRIALAGQAAKLLVLRRVLAVLLLLSSSPVSAPMGQMTTASRITMSAAAPAISQRRSAVGARRPPIADLGSRGSRGSRGDAAAARRTRSPSGIAGTEPFS